MTSNGALYLTGTSMRYALVWNVQSHTNTQATVRYSIQVSSGVPGYVSSSNVVINIYGATSRSYNTGGNVLTVNTSSGWVEVDAWTQTYDAGTGFAVGIHGESYYFGNAGDTTGNWTLDTYMQSSTFTMTDSGSGTTPYFEFGRTITFKTSNPQNGLTFGIWGRFNGTVVTPTVTNNAGNGGTATFTFDAATYAPMLTNGLSADLVFVIDTYQNGNYTGLSWQGPGWKAGFPADQSRATPYLPSVTSVLSDATPAIYTQFASYVQNKSQLSINFSSPILKYGATVSKYSVTVSGDSGSYGNSTSTNVPFNLLTTGTLTVTKTITDSRGYTASTTQTISVVSYLSPSLLSFSIFRCVSGTSAVANDSGSFAAFKIKGQISYANGKNTKKMTLQSRVSGTTTWSAATDISSYINASTYAIDTTGGTTNVNIPIMSAVNTSSFDFLLTITDYFSTIQQAFTIASGFMLINFNNSGKGLAIGQASTSANSFDVYLPQNNYGNVTMNGSLSVTSLAMSGDVMSWTGFGSYPGSFLYKYDARLKIFYIKIKDAYCGGDFGDWAIGSIPSNIWINDGSTSGKMFAIPNWSVDGAMSKLQLNPDGSFHILNTKAGTTYRAIITVPICN